MCNSNALQQKIAELTNGGEDILRFLAETVRGETPGVKTHHRLEASRQLNRLGALGDHPTNNTPSPSTGEGWDGGEKGKTSSPSCPSMSSSPEDQAIFDYQMKIETGSYEECEIEIRPVTEASRRDYAAALKWMQQVAAEEGVPLLPNPLSGTLNHPTARSP